MWGSNNLLFTPIDNEIEQPKSSHPYTENQEFVNSEGEIGVTTSALGNESSNKLGDLEGESSLFDNNSIDNDEDDDYQMVLYAAENYKQMSKD
jgi:hypothetical protein